MGLYTDGERENIDKTIEVWKSRCLLGDGSLLWSGKHLWTRENVDDLRDRFHGNPMYGEPGSFDEKLNKQLAEASSDVRRLATEMLVIYVLFVGWNFKTDSKRALVASVLPEGQSVPDTEPVHSALAERIGSAGPGWHFNRPADFGLLLDAMAAFKALEPAGREALLEEAWDFEEWIDQLEGASTKQMRHMLLNLLFPKTFERIASGQERRTVIEVFGGLVENPPADPDRYLHAIRERLREVVAEKHPELADDDNFDFYRDAIREVWRGGDPENLAALRFKKQLVLYGPPGTSKTYQAKELADGVIRQDALEIWGAGRVFSDLNALDEAVEHNMHRLQLHPAYSYEDFIRGVGISKDGSTEYQPGYLMRLSGDIEKERGKLGDDALPHVLILDEMNRVDLSRVMGEAFSLLEDRGQEVELAGGDPTQPPPKLSLPEDLYVIGTMNLIDQSVEQIDFAMRRRFLWRECRFDEDVLIEVLEERWRATGQPTQWERIEPDMYLLLMAAQGLNSRIATMGVLGERYEVGHTYFLDIVPFLEWQMPPKQASTAKHFLWHGAQPQEALLTLWAFSLMPLLEQYLAGDDAVEAEARIEELRSAFLTKPE